MMNPMRSFMQAGPTPAPSPMMPTMGSAIRGMFGGGRPMATPPAPGTMGQGMGQTVRGMAQAPDRTGGIGQAVSAMRVPGGTNPVLRGIGRRGY
jgi:hypothetical protein